MCALDYYRPATLDEALELLKQGVPLAGGTRLTPGRRELNGVIDLQAIGLDTICQEGDRLKLGAMVTLQDMLENEAVPQALRDAARREAGWHIRNAASLGGILHAADGRSHVLTALGACDVTVQVMPGEKSMSLEAYLAYRMTETVHLVTGVEVMLPQRLSISYVARSPADRPILLVAAAVHTDATGDVYMALGGCGPQPAMMRVNEVTEAAKAAEAVFSAAEDVWASAEYRTSAGRSLAMRLFEEVRP